MCLVLIVNSKVTKFPDKMEPNNTWSVCYQAYLISVVRRHLSRHVVVVVVIVAWLLFALTLTKVKSILFHIVFCSYIVVMLI